MSFFQLGDMVKKLSALRNEIQNMDFGTQTTYILFLQHFQWPMLTETDHKLKNPALHHKWQEVQNHFNPVPPVMAELS